MDRPRQTTPRHSRKSLNKTHLPPDLSPLTSGSFRLGGKCFLVELILFRGCLFVSFLVLDPGRFISVYLYLIQIRVKNFLMEYWNKKPIKTFHSRLIKYSFNISQVVAADLSDILSRNYGVIVQQPWLVIIWLTWK